MVEAVNAEFADANLVTLDGSSAVDGHQMQVLLGSWIDQVER